MSEPCGIPTDEIWDDIRITEIEIKDLRDEVAVLIRNPVENKLRIYMAEGNISRREKFVEKLQAILALRNEPIDYEKPPFP